MMHHKWFSVLGLSFTISVASATGQTVTPEQVHIEDADTLLVELDGASYRIQLLGVDAPESGMNPKLQRLMQRTGLAAAAFLPMGRSANGRLHELLNEFQPYRLVFEPQVKDHYGRTPGDQIDRHCNSLSLRLVQEGYAVPVGPAGQQDKKLLDAANSARQSQRGLWRSHPDAVKAWAAPIH